MRAVVALLGTCAAADLIVCGLVLAVAWAEYRRQRRAAADAGRAAPPPAIGLFLLLAGFVLAGIVTLYGSIWLVLRR